MVGIKKLIKFIPAFWILFLCFFLSFQSLAANNPFDKLVNAKPKAGTLAHSAIFEGRGDGVTICPVSGEKITHKNLKAKFFGRTLYFCCEGCLMKAKREPDRYIKPTNLEQIQAVKAYLAKAPQAPSADEFCNE
jgi:YHS domain-containing protein